MFRPLIPILPQIYISFWKSKIILEKKPQNGGTPAIENKAIMSIFEKKLFEPKSLNDWVVLISKLLNWNNVKNIINRDKLYINI